ncbi:restriction endonuclease [Paracoccus sp. ME4]|uniref:restriction endonuclease n=1 Tax=Paracoccus sp. ME4 TaxID=3138066 RepID=UPI00398B70CF
MTRLLSLYFLLVFCVFFLESLLRGWAGPIPLPVALPGWVSPALALALPLPVILRAAFRRYKARPKSRTVRIRNDRIPEDGLEFEQWVASRLRSYGWKADVTRGSGDQGIDVIGRVAGRTVGIQCKRYKAAVGNKAVQEAYAGMAYHRTQRAAVVTTSRFTKSAEELAARTGVILVHASDLKGLGRRI